MRALRLLILVTFVSMFAGAVAAEPGISPLRDVRNLNEGWRFVQDDNLSPEQALRADGSKWKAVRLPHTWNAEDAASLEARNYKRGVGWYRLEFESPKAGARHWLEFGAASLVADVWLNGERLGQHKGVFTQFRFDVTDHMKKNGRHVLLVRVDNTAPRSEDAPTVMLSGDAKGGYALRASPVERDGRVAARADVPRDHALPSRRKR